MLCFHSFYKYNCCIPQGDYKTRRKRKLWVILAMRWMVGLTIFIDKSLCCGLWPYGRRRGLRGCVCLSVRKINLTLSAQYNFGGCTVLSTLTFSVSLGLTNDATRHWDLPFTFLCHLGVECAVCPILIRVAVPVPVRRVYVGSLSLSLRALQLNPLNYMFSLLSIFFPPLSMRWGSKLMASYYYFWD